MSTTRSRFHTPRFVRTPRLERNRSSNATIRCVAHALAAVGQRSSYLYGWAAASARICCSHMEGFSTGKWEGNMLRITTTHMKEDYLRRNGVSRSSFATLSEPLFVHGDYLTWTTIIYDP